MQGLLCQCCKKPLKHFQFWETDWAKTKGLIWGYMGDGSFCTLRCGYYWALVRVRKSPA